jgi:hypothetical protein
MKILEPFYVVVWTIAGGCIIVVCVMFMYHFAKYDYHLNHQPNVDTVKPDMCINPKMDSCISTIKHKTK